MAVLSYDEHYFQKICPNIYGNEELREPQIQGYYKVYDHFVVRKKKEHAIVVLPTGVGKTGLMGLLPYQMCEGRALIITPQLTIKDAVIDSLDPENPKGFWMRRKIFSSVLELPTLVEYSSSTTREVLDCANIVVLNIHKMQSRLKHSPLNFLPADYFDMIIIDEAHHSTANTWVEAVEHFGNAKVVKLTATPIRTDGVKLAGKLVYKYKLSQAMAKGYVKSLRNLEYIPEKLMLTIDNDNTKEYTVDELLEKGIRDEDWVRRSVAFSKICSESVVRESKKLLQAKRIGSTVPHKIIAVACSIEHAEQIKQLYAENSLRAAVLHSEQSPEEQVRVKSDLENHRLDVIIHVAMLGEGFDHPYLSVAAIFRPFRSELPYEQFVGRVLRCIPSEEVQSVSDNIADIISHRNLYLTQMWEKYKVEIQESEVIKHLQAVNLVDEEKSKESALRELAEIVPLGNVKESGDGRLVEDNYLNTELLIRHKKETEKQKKDIDNLQKLLHIGYEQALAIYNQSRTQEYVALKRPDLYFASQKRNLDVEIRDIIVPELITKFELDKAGKELMNCRLFNGKYTWITAKATDNGALLAMYLNDYMRREIGKQRKDWIVSDYDNAYQKLPVVREYMEKVISEFLEIE